jgi:osmotically inducible protein OsmC
MAIRTSSAEWKGTLKGGSGTMKVGTAWEGPFTFSSRFESGPGTNPEELIGAAQAGCFSMFLAALLTDAGFNPTRIRTTAVVHLDEGPTVTLIELSSEAVVPGLDDASFQKHADKAKKECPISKALTGPKVTLNAKLMK